MKKIYNILFLFIFVSSCVNTSEKQNSSDIIENQTDTIAQIPIETADIYETLRTSIEEGDSLRFDKYIGYVSNIDSLCIGVDENSYSLIGYACKHKQLSILNKLLKQGADINIGFEDEVFAYDAFYISIDEEFTEGFRFLLKNGANPNALYTESAITPLILACMRDNYPMASTLIEAGANVNDGIDMGFDYILYPVIEAVNNNNIKMLQLLVASGARLDVTDKQEQSPLNVAQRNNYTDIEQYISDNLSNNNN